MRQHVVREARVPGLLVDAVVRDAALALSRQQYLAVTQLAYSLTTYNTRRLIDLNLTYNIEQKRKCKKEQEC